MTMKKKVEEDVNIIVMVIAMISFIIFIGFTIFAVHAICSSPKCIRPNESSVKQILSENGSETRHRYGSETANMREIDEEYYYIPIMPHEIKK